MVFGLQFPFGAGLTKQSTAKMISGFDHLCLSPSSTHNHDHPKLCSGGIPAFICKPNLTLQGKPHLNLQGKPHLTIQILAFVQVWGSGPKSRAGFGAQDLNKGRDWGSGPKSRQGGSGPK